MSGGSNLGAGHQARRAAVRDAALGATGIAADVVGDMAAHAAQGAGLGRMGAAVAAGPLRLATAVADVGRAALQAKEAGDPHYARTGLTTAARDIATDAAIRVVLGPGVAAAHATLGAMEWVAPATDRVAARAAERLGTLPVGIDVHDAEAERAGLLLFPGAAVRGRDAVQAAALRGAARMAEHDALEDRMAGLPDLRPAPAAAPVPARAAAPGLSLRRSADTNIAPPATRRRAEVPPPSPRPPAAAPGIGGSMSLSGFVNEQGRLGVSASASGGGGSSLTAGLVQGGGLVLGGSVPVVAPAGLAAVAAPLAAAAAVVVAVVGGVEVGRAINLNQHYRYQPIVPLSDADAATRLDAVDSRLAADPATRRLEQEHHRLTQQLANDARRQTRVSEREATPAGHLLSGVMRSIGRVFGGVDATRPRDAERDRAATEAELARTRAQLDARARPFQAGGGGGAGAGGSAHSSNERRG